MDFLTVLGEALADDDGDTFAQASGDLELSSSRRIRTRLGENDDLEEASSEIHDQVNRLREALSGSGVEADGGHYPLSNDAE